MPYQLLLPSFPSRNEKLSSLCDQNSSFYNFFFNSSGQSTGNQHLPKSRTWQFTSMRHTPQLSKTTGAIPQSSCLTQAWLRAWLRAVLQALTPDSEPQSGRYGRPKLPWITGWGPRHLEHVSTCQKSSFPVRRGDRADEREGRKDHGLLWVSNYNTLPGGQFSYEVLSWIFKPSSMYHVSFWFTI